VYCYGQRLPITSYAPASSASPSPISKRWQHENISESDSAVSESLVSYPSHRESQTELSVMVAGPDASEDNDGENNEVFSLAPELTSWLPDIATACPLSRHSPDTELCVVNCQKLSGSDTVELSYSDSPLSFQCYRTCPDDNAGEELAETDDNCKLSDDDDRDVYDGGLMISKCDAVEQDNEMSVCQSQSELVHEKLRRNAELSTPSSEQTRKLYFSEEKVCLLDKIVTAGNIEFPCTVRVIMAENAVELVAVDDVITETEIKLYELIANCSRVWLHLPGGIVKLLLSIGGQRWLQSQLASVSAVFHAKDSTSPCVIGVDSSTSAAAKYLLENALSSKKIPFDHHQATFLRSTQWISAINKFESEYFVAVNIEFGDNKIVVEGSVEALNDICKSIEVMLKQNSKVQRKISMSPEQFQLLMHFRVEIQDKLKSETSQQQQNRYTMLLAFM